MKIATGTGKSGEVSFDQPLRALIWMVVSGLGFTGMSVLVKRLSGFGLGASALVFSRSLVNAVVALAIVYGRKRNPWPKTTKRILALRGIAGFLGLTCLFYGLAHLPLPVASLLNWCSPVFVILFSRLFLRQATQPRALGLIAVSFSGLILVLMPSELGLVALHQGLWSWTAIAVGLTGAAFGAIAFLAVRRATSEQPTEVIVLWFTAMATLLSLPWFLIETSTWLPRLQEHPSLWLQLLFLGLFATLGQFAMTLAYRYAQAPIVSSMSLMNAGFMAAAGWWFFGEVLRPIQTLGVLIMAFGVAQLGAPWPFGRKKTTQTSLPLINQ